MPRFAGIPVDQQPTTGGRFGGQAVGVPSSKIASSPVASPVAAINDTLGAGTPLGLTAHALNYLGALINANTPEGSNLRKVSHAIISNAVAAPEALSHHVGNIPVGVAQLATHGANALAGGNLGPATDAVDQFAKDREDAYQRNVPTNVGSVVGATAGEVLPWMTGLGELRAAGLIPKATTTAQKVSQLAAEGAAVGAVQPVTSGDSFATTKALQTGIGAVTGPAAYGIGRGVGSVAGGVRTAIQNIRDPGPAADRQIAARFGTDPDTILKLLKPKQLLPGEVVSPAQAAPSARTIAAERVIRNAPSTKEALADQDAANNAVRNSVFERLAGTDEQLQAARNARTSATQPFIDANLKPQTPLTRWTGASQPLDAILTKPGRMPAADFDALQQARAIVAKVRGGSMQEDDAYQALKDLEETASTKKARDAFSGAFDAVNKGMIDPGPTLSMIAKFRNTGLGARPSIRTALDSITRALQESQNTRGLVPMDVMDTIRQNAGDYIVKPNGARATAQEMAALVPVKHQIQKAIGQLAPGYSDYLATYAKSSEPINTMEAVRSFLDRNNRSGVDTSGSPQRTIDALRSFLRRDDRARYGMSDDAVRQLEGVRDSLQRRMISDQKVAAAGPATAADTQAAALARRGSLLFGDPVAGKPGPMTRILGSATGGTLGGLIGGIPGSIAGASAGMFLPEAVGRVNQRVAERIAANTVDSREAGRSILRALAEGHTSSAKQKGKLLQLLQLLQQTTLGTQPPVRTLPPPMSPRP